MASDSRERMVLSAVQLFREHGYSGTGFRDVIAHSGAPRGSIYHHFPGGKAQLGQEAARAWGRLIQDGMSALAADADVVTMLHIFLGLWRQMLSDTEFRAGCPIVAVAVEVHDEAPELTDTVSEVFTEWRETLATTLRAEGVSATRAASLSTLMIAAVEGAVVLCQADRSTQPLDEVGAELEVLIRAALEVSTAN